MKADIHRLGNGQKWTQESIKIILTPIYSHLFIEKWLQDALGLTESNQLIGHFGKKSLFFRDTRDHTEHGAKNRSSLPSPSSEKPLAEIHQLKKTTLVADHWMLVALKITKICLNFCQPG